MKRKLQLKPKVAPSIKLSTTLIYVAGGIILASIIGIILFIQLNLGNTTDSYAAPGTYTSLSSGDWTTNNIWQGGVAPGVSLNGGAVTISGNSSIFYRGNITADNNVTLTIEANATLTIDGDFIVKNNLILNNSGTLIITGNLLAENNSSITVNGGGSMEVGNDITFANNTNFTVNGSLTTGGNVTFGNGATFGGNGQVRIGGTGCQKWSGSSTACDDEFIIMPVKLLDFKAKDDGDGTVLITWSTAMENNSDYFTIERSTDGIAYNELQTVKGMGTTNEVSHYEIRDISPAAKRLYYRLTQTDYDGTSEMFESVFVQVALKEAQLSAYPNPMTGRELTVNLPEAEAGSIQFMDNRGMVIMTQKVDGSSTVINLQVTSDLAPGFYYVNYKPVNGAAQTLKIIKK